MPEHISAKLGPHPFQFDWHTLTTDLLAQARRSQKADCLSAHTAQERRCISQDPQDPFIAQDVGLPWPRFASRSYHNWQGCTPAIAGAKCVVWSRTSSICPILWTVGSGRTWSLLLKNPQLTATVFRGSQANVCRNPVLALRVANRPSLLETDSSYYHISVPLLQRQYYGTTTNWEPIGYRSFSLNDLERPYYASERECLALVWWILTLRTYI